MTQQQIEKKFEQLTAQIKSYNSKEDIALVKKAWKFAKMAHTGQKRYSGEDYVNHAIEAALRLAQWKLDTTSIIAGLLHDTIEDGGAKDEDIVKEFGEDVARLVKGVTKVSGVRLRGNRNEAFVENLRKMFLAMAKDVRVVLVKLADRYHNTQTLYAVPEEKRKRIARETIEIYAPLAERLGMGEVKAQLEDMAFPHLSPEDYKKVKKDSRPHYKETGKIIERMKRTILSNLAEEGIRANIQAREKHLYSLWKKFERPEIGWDFEKIHDIVAMRILVDEVSQCYTALGVVHALYKPVPYVGVSDFIAQPKPNGYRSIHTKVFGPRQRIVEVQIRTKLMHEEAEYGIAAHWAYSEAKFQKVKDSVLDKAGVKITEDKLAWVSQLVEWQKEITDSREFLKAVKFDALKHRNFVFSPKGDVYDLPAGATPVDFAYAVHTGLGKHIKGAKVNGRMVPLDYKLRSGDIVEIIRAKKESTPNKDWLEFVVTRLARSEVKKAHKN